MPVIKTVLDREPDCPQIPTEVNSWCTIRGASEHDVSV